jgi:hypothetical protein
MKIVFSSLVCSIVCVLFQPNAHAADSITYTFEPANPTTADFIRLRLDIAGCLSADGMTAEVNPEEPSIEARILFSDVACDPDDPENVTPQFIDVGHVPANAYVTRVSGCVLAPPPEPGEEPLSCSVIQTGVLLVRSAALAPSVIPAATPFGLFGLAMIVLLWGHRALRPR